MGAAMLAGRAVGVWNDSDLTKLQQPDREFVPNMDDVTRENYLRQWQRAIDRSRSWAQQDLVLHFNCCRAWSHDFESGSDSKSDGLRGGYNFPIYRKLHREAAQFAFSVRLFLKERTRCP